jgi:uncharacterized protein YlxP (DUF503 family)
VDVRLPHCHSLKEKRAVVKTMLQGASRRFGVAASEVDHQDKWQRAAFGFASVAGTEAHVREVLDNVERFVWSFPEVEVVNTTLRWMETD